MSLNETPRSNRIHIAFFGRRNAGKSSLINAITGQELSVVSPVLGTTTDPVYKAMELLPIGPVVMIDTAGLDDEGELGALRINKTKEVLNKTDIAIIVADIKGLIAGDIHIEQRLIKDLNDKKITTILIANKTDLLEEKETNIKEEHKKEINLKENLIKDISEKLKVSVIATSVNDKSSINTLKERLSKLVPEEPDKFQIVGDLIRPQDVVVLVVPIDKAAPKGRLILPQQQTIRDILEADAMAIVTKEHELKDTLNRLKDKPKMVITDSQAFLKVAADTPRDVLMTSFSILFARHKGDLVQMIKGIKAIERLEDGDKVLVSEACTHHSQSDDIGTVKIPRWIRQKTGKDIRFEHTSGLSYKDNLEEYKLIVHCGGCMLNKRAMLWRIEEAINKGVQITNYGVLIAYVHGILERALEPFPLAKMIYDAKD